MTKDNQSAEIEKIDIDALIQRYLWAMYEAGQQDSKKFSASNRVLKEQSKLLKAKFENLSESRAIDKLEWLRKVAMTPETLYGKEGLFISLRDFNDAVDQTNKLKERK